ncbi:enoyl-CoA hydratase-related protein [Nocardia aurea]|uniref:enoyl-CoA hydratase-related protein n=1 Tax=Nocardia aurea TaxID=2144174 RepID=UPI000D699094|nr:enoyl-CoA hydratase-related protein [Nocardia aurea]
MPRTSQQIGNPDAVLAERPPRTYPLTIRKPMIAAINGAVAGLGLIEALYCDIRMAVPAAKFTTAFARRGLIAEYGIAWLLPRLVGPSKAMDATELATFCSPTSMSVIKQQVQQALDSDFTAAVAHADALMLESFEHPDAVEGVQSYLQRRSPLFAGLEAK